jgi:ATP-dependent protease ClpP protease subunit
MIKRSITATAVALFSLNVWAANSVTLTKDNTIVMNSYFDQESVAKVAAKAREQDAKIPSGEPLYLIIDSGGGSIEAGIELIENLNTLNRPVHTVTIFSASMGFQTVQGVKGSRLVLENGTLMSHRARGGFSGEFPGQLDSRYAHYLKRVQRLDKKAVSRSGGKQSDKSYADAISNEMWCDGADCVALGYADQVIVASCDQSLKGVSNLLVDRFMYMGHTVEIVEQHSNCPSITGALSWNILVDGQPLFAVDLNTAFTAIKPTTTYVYNEAVIKTLNLETAENIKRLVNEKAPTGTMANRTIKYY